MLDMPPDPLDFRGFSFEAISMPVKMTHYHGLCPKSKLHFNMGCAVNVSHTSAWTVP